MADEILSYAIKIDDVAGPALVHIETEAKRAAESMRGVQAAAASASVSLREVAAASRWSGDGVAAAAPKLAMLATQTTALVGPSNAAKASMMNLGFQINDMATMAAMGASPMRILASQGGQIVQVMTQAGGATALFRAALATVVGWLPAIGAALPPVGIAVAAVAAGWAVYANGVEEAKTSTDGIARSLLATANATVTAKMSAEDLGKAWSGFATIARDAQDKIDILNGATTSNQVSARNASAEAVAATKAVRDELAKQYAAQMDIVQSQRALLIGGKLSIDMQEKATASMVTAQSAADDYRRKLDEVGRQTAETTGNLHAAARAADDKAAADKAATEAAKAAAAAAAAHAKAQREAAEALRLAKEAARAHAEALAALLAEAEAWGAVTFGPATKALENINADLDEFLAKMEKAAKTHKIEVLASVVTQAAGGPGAVMSGVASAGPWGAIIAAIVELAGNLKGVGDMFNDFTKNLQDSIGKLPQTIADNLPKWLQTAVDSIGVPAKFISSLAASIPKILTAIIGSLGDIGKGLMQSVIRDMPKAAIALVGVLLDPMTWIGMIAALVDAFAGIVAEFGKMIKQVFDEFFGQKQKETPGLFDKGGWVDNAGKDIAGLFSSKNQDSYDIGGMVRKTGLTWVHKGEWVTRSNGSGSQMGGGTHSNVSNVNNGGVTINARGGFLDARFANEIARSFAAQTRWRGVKFG